MKTRTTARRPVRFCLIHPDNSASIRVALKCGYREMLRSTYKGQPTVIFVR